MLLFVADWILILGHRKVTFPVFHGDVSDGFYFL